ncbi:SMI1/KNR4 family protein [Dactylosporangium sp. NPDC006015]|uniref:SMI1/KNR4 family protein n=1 Tax=Dactylosporangium sp. NPDC006015 TaxID=3154576 RepID=UPI0033AF77A6
MTADPVDWPGVRGRMLGLTPPAGDAWPPLEPPLTPAELAAVQHQLGVELPADYRRFLLHVGRGGAGPDGGLHPLEHDADGWSWRVHTDWDPNDLTTLAEPFPLRSSDWRTAEELLDDCPDWDTFSPRNDYEEAWQAWHDRHEATMYNPRRTHGAFSIANDGAGTLRWLIVTGPERGHVWLDHRLDGRGMAPAWLPHHRRVTFGQWYLRWLETAEAGSKATRAPR